MKKGACAHTPAILDTAILDTTMNGNEEIFNLAQGQIGALVQPARPVGAWRAGAQKLRRPCWSIIVSTVKDASAAALGAWCGSLALAEGVATGQEALVPIGQHQKVNTKLGINEHS